VGNRAYRKVGPKRPVEKTLSTILDTDVGTGVTNNVLHAAEDAKTIIRIKGNLSFICDAAAASVIVAWSFQIAPQGTHVHQPVVAASLDVDVPMELIAEGIVHLNFQGGGDQIEVLIDIKSMRKMKVGDTLVHSVISSAAARAAQAAKLTVFTKE